MNDEKRKSTIVFYNKPKFDDYPITTQTVCAQMRGKFHLSDLYQKLSTIIDPEARIASNKIIQIMRKTILLLNENYQTVSQENNILSSYMVSDDIDDIEEFRNHVIQQTLELSPSRDDSETIKSQISPQMKKYKTILRQARTSITTIVDSYVPKNNIIRYVQYKTFVVGLMPAKKYKIKIKRRTRNKQDLVKIENRKKKTKKSNEAFMNQVTISIYVKDGYVNVKIFPDGNLVFTGCRQEYHSALAMDAIMNILRDLNFEIDAYRPELKVSMTNKIFKLGFNINREMLDTLINDHPELGFESTYDPCDKSSVSVNYQRTNTFTIFLKGTIIHSGKELEKMREPFNKFIDFIDEHIFDIMLENVYINGIFSKHYKNAKRSEKNM